MSYDSAKDTLEHIKHVNTLLIQVATLILKRATEHDNSKLESPEKETFDKATPKLRSLTYGSDEYRSTLREIKPALKHHYENNSHHPEYYQNGVNDMDLLDLIEMLCDWKAATLRHEDGNIQKSLRINKQRFNIDHQLQKIIENTCKNLNFS